MGALGDREFDVVLQLGSFTLSKRAILIGFEEDRPLVYQLGVGFRLAVSCRLPSQRHQNVLQYSRDNRL